MGDNTNGAPDESADYLANLRRLFAESDTDQNGSLGREEFRELCAKIGLASEAAEETFQRLDLDRDGRITFGEFLNSFQKYHARRSEAGATGALAELPQGACVRPASAPGGPLRRVHQLAAAGSSCSSLGELGGGGAGGSPGCGTPTSLAFELAEAEAGGASAGAAHEVVYSSEGVMASGPLAGQFGSGQFGSLPLSSSTSLSSATAASPLRNMQDLLECVQKLQSENQILTQMFFKDKRQREEYMSQLGEELDQQVREVEERASRRAREEIEQEKRRLRDMMQAELETLEQHYATIERVGKLIRAPNGGAMILGESGELLAAVEGALPGGEPTGRAMAQKVRSQLEDTHLENKQLKKMLHETKTDVAMIWREMEKLKRQYEERLSSAYERHQETQSECDHIKQQLSMMKDSNRKLQDASDVLTNYIADKIPAPDDLSQLLQAPGLRTRNASSLSTGSRRGSVLSSYLNGDGEGEGDFEDDDRVLSVEETRSWSQQSPAASGRGSAAAAARLGAVERARRRRASSLDQAQALGQTQARAQSQAQAKTRTGPESKAGARFYIGGAANADDGPPKLRENRDSFEMRLVRPADGPSVRTCDIILVGDPFVGKSSFAARLMEGDFVQGLPSNCSIDFKTRAYKIDGVNYTVNLWDTAGQERFRSITASYFRKADGIILMYDVTERRSYLNVRNWMGTIDESAAEGVPVLLVGNKIDLRPEPAEGKGGGGKRERTQNRSLCAEADNCVPLEEGIRLAQEYQIVFLETSVKTGTNLLPSMAKLVRLIMKKNKSVEEDKDRIKLNAKDKSYSCVSKHC